MRLKETIALFLTMVIGVAIVSPSSAEIIDHAVIGWDGDKQGVISHLNGSYHIRRDEGAVPVPRAYDISFGIYDNATPRVFWYNEKNPPDLLNTEGGYLPCLVTKFERPSQQCTVWISNFGKEVFLRNARERFVFVYTRVTVFNHGSEEQTVEPAPTVSPSSGPRPLVLTKNSTTVRPNEWVSHDYVLAADRFGGQNPWPTDSELVEAGGWEINFANMAKYWDEKLSQIVNIADLPDPELIRAYKAGYINTLIVKDGDELRVGEEQYEQELFERDKVEMLAALLTIGDPDALKYLNAFSTGSAWLDPDAKAKYPWLWALYLSRYPNPNQAVSDHLAQIKSIARNIHDQDRCLTTARCSPAPPVPPDPNRLIKPRSGLEVLAFNPQATPHAMEYLATDNLSALTGLASYKYICEKLSSDLRCVDVGKGIDERKWAESEYLDLFDAISTVHAQTIQRLNLDYLPVDMYYSNDSSVLLGPWDANWALMLGFSHWAWDAYLLGLPAQDGTELGMIDPTYISRFRAAKLECHNFGGFYGIGYSSAYNAGFANAALRGESYRSEGIYAYQFLLKNGQSGPFSWWESFTDGTLDNTPWVGRHPRAQVSPSFSCPHISGQATATKMLIDSLIALRGNGEVIIGRGLPNEWITELISRGTSIKVFNFPILQGNRIGFSITGIPPNKIRLELDKANPNSATILDLQALKNNIQAVTTGSPNPHDGTVNLSSGTTTTTVTLTTANPRPIPTPPPIMVALPISTIPSAESTFTPPVVSAGIDSAENLIGFQGDFSFDSSVVSFEATPVQTAGLTANDWTINGNITGAGKIKNLRIVGYALSSTTPLQGSGTLFELRMKRISGSAGAMAPLNWSPPDDFFFITSRGERVAPASAPPGRITIGGTAPTPSSGSIADHAD